VGAYAYALLMKKAAVPFVVAMAAAPVAGLLSGLVIGFFCVRNKGLYFAFLTLAFGQMVYLILFRWYSLTGGEDGIINVPVPAWLSGQASAYYFSLAVGVLCLLLLLTLTNSAFGAVLHATRDNPERVRFSGIKAMRYQLASFGIASMFAAVAGAQYVTLTKAAFIEYVGLETGILALFACLLGGMNTFYGPLVGTVLIVALDKLIGSYTQHWSAIMGGAVILVAILFPKGIVGYLKHRARGWKEVKGGAEGLAE
jgi:branched-chain amino acid transport system permease protein